MCLGEYSKELQQYNKNFFFQKIQGYWIEISRGHCIELVITPSHWELFLWSHKWKLPSAVGWKICLGWAAIGWCMFSKVPCCEKLILCRCEQPDIRSVPPSTFHGIGWRSQGRELLSCILLFLNSSVLEDKCSSRVASKLSPPLSSFYRLENKWILVDVMLLTLGCSLCVHGSGYSWMQDSLLTAPTPVFPSHSPYTAKRVLVKELTYSFQFLSIAQESYITGIKSVSERQTSYVSSPFWFLDYVSMHKILYEYAL